MAEMDGGDRGFLDRVADRLAALPALPALPAVPAVQAVALDGSRAQGTHRPDSDWDMAVY